MRQFLRLIPAATLTFAAIAICAGSLGNSRSASAAQHSFTLGADGDPTRYHESVLYALSGDAGAYPAAGMVADSAGNLYGVSADGDLAYGAVFKLTPSPSGYIETTLHIFKKSDNEDGGSPRGALVIDGAGALYGTTIMGGGFNWGTVFKLTPTSSTYSYSIIYRFQGWPTDGAQPQAAVTLGPDGVLFGTTGVGGPDNAGTVFELRPGSGAYTETILHSFKAGDGGNTPVAPVILAPGGKLFGTTSLGGPTGCSGRWGCGTAFELAPSKNGYRERVIYRFGSRTEDAAGPVAPLVRDDSGNLFGTAGGGRCAGRFDFACGTVYELHPEGSGYHETVLYRFGGGADGSHPEGGLLLGPKGALFGTAAEAGVKNGCAMKPCGEVFRLSPGPYVYHKATLFAFAKPAEGSLPVSSLIATAQGHLIGTTAFGGVSGSGNVFELTP